MCSSSFVDHDRLKGEIILFYVPLERNVTVYREIMGKIIWKSEARINSDVFDGKNNSTSVLLFSIPRSVSTVELERIFKSFGEVKEILYKSSYNSESYSQNRSDVNDESTEPFVYITYHNSLPINKIVQESTYDPNYLFRMLYVDYDTIFGDNGRFNRKERSNQGINMVITEIMGKRAEPEFLKKEIDLYMAKQDLEAEIKRENMKLESTVPDEDGFIRVVNKKQKTPDGTVVYSFVPEADDCIRGSRAGKNAKNKKQKEYSDFYKFQIREQKKHDVQRLFH